MVNFVGDELLNNPFQCLTWQPTHCREQPEDSCGISKCFWQNLGDVYHQKKILKDFCDGF